jgi:S-adenosylhomocysteine hydrolase
MSDKELIREFSDAGAAGFFYQTQQTTDPNKLKRLVETWRIGKLSIQGYNFLSKMVRDLNADNSLRPDVITCCHVYEMTLPDIFVIPQYASPVAMIPKNSSCLLYPDIKQRIEDEGYPVVDIHKTELYEPEKAVAFIKSKTSSQPFYIADHGGYFAHAAELICLTFDKNQFLGFTEYTANGEDRYIKFAKSIDRPIVSIARCNSKSISDRSSGILIADMVANKFREISGMNLGALSSLKIGVIGLGPIGRYVARRFKDLANTNIMVCEIDGFRIANAAHQCFEPADIEEIVTECDIIQSANGKAALRSPKLWGMMKDNAVIASSTSADDELDLEGLIRDGVLELNHISNGVATYTIKSNGKKVHLIANGEAANTLDRSGIGDATLFLPQALQIAANLMIGSRDNRLIDGFQRLPDDVENKIAFAWTRYFHTRKIVRSPAESEYESIIKSS